MQNKTNTTYLLLKAEISQEFKKPVFIASGFLQQISVVMICYLSNNQVSKPLWNSLYWISLLFVSLQIVGKNFLGIHKNRWLYMNQLAPARQLFMGKLLYGWVLMTVISVLNLLLFSLFLDFPVNHLLPFCLIVWLGAISFCTVFTFNAAIASKIPQGGFVLPVLSLPVIIPFLLVAIQGSLKCFNPVLVNSTWTDIAVLAGLNILIFAMSSALFNPLWKD